MPPVSENSERRAPALHDPRWTRASVRQPFPVEYPLWCENGPDHDRTVYYHVTDPVPGTDFTDHIRWISAAVAETPIALSEHKPTGDCWVFGDERRVEEAERNQWTRFTGTHARMQWHECWTHWLPGDAAHRPSVVPVQTPEWRKLEGHEIVRVGDMYSAAHIADTFRRRIGVPAKSEAFFQAARTAMQNEERKPVAPARRPKQHTDVLEANLTDDYYTLKNGLAAGLKCPDGYRFVLPGEYIKDLDLVLEKGGWWRTNNCCNGVEFSVGSCARIRKVEPVAPAPKSIYRQPLWRKLRLGEAIRSYCRFERKTAPATSFSSFFKPGIGYSPTACADSRHEVKSAYVRWYFAPVEAKPDEYAFLDRQGYVVLRCKLGDATSKAGDKPGLAFQVLEQDERFRGKTGGPYPQFVSGDRIVDSTSSLSLSSGRFVFLRGTNGDADDHVGIQRYGTTAERDTNKVKILDALCDWAYNAPEFVDHPIDKGSCEGSFERAHPTPTVLSENFHNNADVAELARLKGEFELQDKANATLEEKLTECRATLGREQKEHVRLLDQLDTAEDKIKYLQSDLASRDEEVSYLKHLHNEQLQTLEKRNATIVRLGDELDEAKISLACNRQARGVFLVQNQALTARIAKFEVQQEKWHALWAAFKTLHALPFYIDDHELGVRNSGLNAVGAYSALRRAWQDCTARKFEPSSNVGQSCVARNTEEAVRA